MPKVVIKPWMNDSIWIQLWNCGRSLWDNGREWVRVSYSRLDGKHCRAELQVLSQVGSRGGY